MMAAGTQATEGRTCSPEISGPNARRSGATWASSSPIGVAMATLIRKPTSPRCSEVHTASCSEPSAQSVPNCPSTSSGPGTRSRRLRPSET